MDKNRILRLLTTTIITTILTINVILAIVYGATANAYAFHPQVKVYGVVTKPVYIGHEWQKYVADDGLTYTLPFSRQEKNISISFSNIVFDENFENSTVTDTLGSTEFNVEANLLGTENPYIVLTMTNKSAVSPEAGYYACVRQLVDIPISNDYYVLVTAYATESLDSVINPHAVVRMLVLDSGNVKHWLIFMLAGWVLTPSITYSSSSTFDSITADLVQVKISATAYKTYQAKLADILSAVSKEWSLAKVTRIYLYLGITTSNSITDSSITASAYFRHVRLLPSKCYIDDGSQSGLVVNGTSGNFPYSAGDIIQIYGANASKITSVSIPFVYEDDRSVEERVTTIPQSYGFQYEWRFVMPKSPSDTGDKFTYSSTNITLYCWFDGAYIKNLWVNGVDKTSAVSSKKTPTTTGLTDEERYWTYGLASSLTGGNQYDVEMRVEDLPSDVWYALTQEPQKILTWSWFYDRILAIIQAILNFLGFSVTSIELKRRELRVPKAS